jgi:hypothetical protein
MAMQEYLATKKESIEGARVLKKSLNDFAITLMSKKCFL